MKQCTNSNLVKKLLHLSPLLLLTRYIFHPNFGAGTFFIHKSSTFAAGTSGTLVQVPGNLSALVVGKSRAPMYQGTNSSTFDTPT